jgi:hypothetical protein
VVFFLEAVHFYEELIKGRVAFSLTPESAVSSTLSADGVKFVDKNNTSPFDVREFLRLLE